MTIQIINEYLGWYFWFAIGFFTPFAIFLLAEIIIERVKKK